MDNKSTLFVFPWLEEELKLDESFLTVSHGYVPPPGLSDGTTYYDKDQDKLMVWGNTSNL